jgi:hypothetical protein
MFISYRFSYIFKKYDSLSHYYGKDETKIYQIKVLFYTLFISIINAITLTSTAPACFGKKKPILLRYHLQQLKNGHL